MTATWVHSEKKPHRSIAFANYAEWVDYCERVDTPTASAHGCSRAFSGTDSFDEAIAVARSLSLDLSDEWRERIATLSDRICAAIVRPAPVYDVTGACVDMGRYAAGDPESCIDWRHEVVFGQSPEPVSLIASIAASASVLPETIAQRGQAIAALASVLDASGRPVRLILDCSQGPQYQGEGEIEIRTVLKNWGQPLEISSIVFALAHPSALRRLMFRVMESLDEQDRDRWGFYADRGYSYAALTRGAGEGHSLVLPPALARNGFNWNNQHTVREWIVDVCQKQGVKFEGDVR